MSKIVKVGDLVSVEDIRSKKEKLYRVEHVFIIHDSLNKDEVNDIVYHITPYPFTYDLENNPIIMYRKHFKKIYKEVEIDG